MSAAIDIKKERETISIRPGDRSLLRYVNEVHKVDLPAGVLREDLTKHKTWQLVANKIRAFDEIVVIAEDLSYMAKLFVLDKSGNDLHIELLDFYEFNNFEAMEDKDYMVEKRGTRKFCVINRSTGDIISDKHPTKANAEIRKIEYIKERATNAR